MQSITTFNIPVDDRFEEDDDKKQRTVPNLLVISLILPNHVAFPDVYDFLEVWYDDFLEVLYARNGL